MHGSTTVSHTGVQEWRAFQTESDAMSQAAYDAGLAIGRMEAEASLGPASTTPPPPAQRFRSINEDWSPSCDE